MGKEKGKGKKRKRIKKVPNNPTIIPIVRVVLGEGGGEGLGTIGLYSGPKISII